MPSAEFAADQRVRCFRKLARQRDRERTGLSEFRPAAIAS
jgi:hypothetical protein